MATLFKTTANAGGNELFGSPMKSPQKQYGDIFSSPENRG
jgi:hypothetical protein